MNATLHPPASAPPIVIAGGGPVGLTLGALLASRGVRSIVIEADAGYCTGSRAICMSRRSQEILGWVGADAPLVAKGLSWVGGRSHYRDTEVLHFEMPSEPSQRFAPMVNIQQFYAEQFAHEAAQRFGDLCDVRWGTRVTAVRRDGDAPVEVDIEAVDGPKGGAAQTLRADWLVACDGGRSTVREQLGLALQGTQYEGRYVIVDIEQATQRPVERLAWFDPPSNPGSTILMHRQPDDIWRIDYQIRDDEDPAEAVKPENVLPRVASHLAMIGETAPWTTKWISIYNAKCLSLEHYRHGRVLFAGDAAHLVPIFGVRGLNSGLDDAANLAWKLAHVVRGASHAALLDSYSYERVQATRENLAHGAKSTEFMAPPDAGFRLMREAALRLSTEDERVKTLLNPRQSTPIAHPGSPLNLVADEAAFDGGAPAGTVAPEAALHSARGNDHLTRHFGQGFVALLFGAPADAPNPPLPNGLALLRILPAGTPEIGATAGHAVADAFDDPTGQAFERYAARAGTLYLIRPDGYVLGRWRHADAATLRAALAPYQRDHAGARA
jgi:3-(3-hydroxy-phenyl)propionate hydroxylase